MGDTLSAASTCCDTQACTTTLALRRTHALNAHFPAPFGAGKESFDPNQTLRVSGLHSKLKLMKVGDAAGPARRLLTAMCCT